MSHLFIVAQKGIKLLWCETILQTEDLMKWLRACTTFEFEINAVYFTA